MLGFRSCLTCWVSGAVSRAGFQELFDVLGFYRRCLRAEIFQELFDVLGFYSCLTCWVSGVV